MHINDRIQKAENIAIECIEKQIPREPISKTFVHVFRNGETWGKQQYYTCPTCGERVEVEDNEGYLTEYYPTCECGQRIDWNGVIETYEMKWINDSIKVLDWSDNE